MKISGLSRYALSFVAAAMLAACGGSQPPIGAAGAVPQTSALAAHADRGTSWMRSHSFDFTDTRPDTRESSMRRDAKNRKALLYVSDWATDDVFVYDYPGGRAMGKLTGFSEPYGQCVDRKGDVYITNFASGVTDEFAHGGKKPLNVYTAVGNAIGCSVNSNGDLAVTIWYPGTAWVWKGGKGTPTSYSDTGYCYYLWPMGYDDKGDLIGEGEYSANFICAVLSGATAMTTLSFNGTIYYPGAVMWDGQYIDITDQQAEYNTTGIEPSTLSGSTLTASKELILEDSCNGDYTTVVWPFVVGRKNTPVNTKQGTVVLGANLQCPYGKVDFWKYPAGGYPTSSLSSPPEEPYGESVSLKN